MEFNIDFSSEHYDKVREKEKENELKMAKEFMKRGIQTCYEEVNGEIKSFEEIENIKHGDILYYVDPFAKHIHEVTYQKSGIGMMRESDETTFLRRSNRERVHVKMSLKTTYLHTSCPFKHLYKEKEKAEAIQQKITVWNKIRKQYREHYKFSYLHTLYNAWKTYKHSDDKLKQMIESMVSAITNMEHYNRSEMDMFWIKELYLFWERKNKNKTENQLVLKDLIYEDCGLNIDSKERGMTKWEITNLTEYV